MATGETLDRKTARFLAAVSMEMPKVSSDIMQHYIDNPQDVGPILAGFLEKPKEGLKKKKRKKPQASTLDLTNPYLADIPGMGPISVAATNGRETIADAKDVFEAGIYGYTDKLAPSVATLATNAIVKELSQDGIFRQVYDGFGADLNRFAWDQGQVVEYCRNNRDKLGRAGNFFLVRGKKKDEVFVANVHLDDDGRLHVLVDGLDDDYVWHADYRHRFVVPQQALCA